MKDNFGEGLMLTKQALPEEKLIQAILMNDENEALNLIKKVPDLSKKIMSFERMSPLQVAVKCNNFNLLKAMLYQQEKNRSFVDCLIKLAMFSVIKAKFELLENKNIVGTDGKTLLMQAVLNARGKEVLSFLVDGGVDVDQQDYQGKTALMHGVLSKNEMAVRFLLSRGANNQLKDKSYRTALSYAAQMGNVNLVKLLSENADEKELKNAFLKALQAEKGYVLSYLLEEKKLSEAVYVDNDKLLNLFVKLGNEKQVAQLLATKKVDVNGCPDKGQTPLVIAIYENQGKMARFLIEHGADVLKESGQFPDLTTPFLMASEKGNVFLMKLILEAAKKQNKNKNISKEEVVKQVIEWQNPKGEKALWMAVKAGEKAAVSFLLKNKAETKSSFMQDALLQLALKQTTSEMAMLLIQNGVDVNETISSGNGMGQVTLLEEAILTQDRYAIEFLLKHGASLSANKEESALYYAVCKQDHESVYQLLNHRAFEVLTNEQQVKVMKRAYLEFEKRSGTQEEWASFYIIDALEKARKMQDKLIKQQKMLNNKKQDQHQR